MTKYVVRIKPGVYYIDRGYNHFTSSNTYDLTDNIDKATKYTQQSYYRAEIHAKKVYGEVYKIDSDMDELKKEVKNLRIKLYNIKQYINDYLGDNKND